MEHNLGDGVHVTVKVGEDVLDVVCFLDTESQSKRSQKDRLADTLQNVINQVYTELQQKGLIDVE